MKVGANEVKNMTMKNHSILILLGVATTGSLVFAAQIDLTKLPPASEKPGITYAKDIRPLLEASCLRCHSGDRPRANLRLDSLKALLAGGEHGQVIVAGKSKESRLLIAVAQLDEETAMPPKRGLGRGGPGGPGSAGRSGGPGGAQEPRNQGPPPTPLTAEQVVLVRGWIDQGAK